MKAYELSEGDQVMLHGHLWTVASKRVTRKAKVEVWVHRGARQIKLPLMRMDEEVPVPRRANEALKFDEAPQPGHTHEWTTLWQNLGEGMRQDVHTHACTDLDCYHLLVGPERECNGVLTNHSHEHAMNMAAYALRPPRGDNGRKEDAVGDKRQSVMPTVVKYLLSRPNQPISLDEIVRDTGFTADQVSRVMSNLKAPSRHIEFGKYIAVLSTGQVWEYRPARGVKFALAEVRGVDDLEAAEAEPRDWRPAAARPEPPPMPDEPGDKLPPEPKPGPVEPKIPTPREMAEELPPPRPSWVAGLDGVYTEVGKTGDGTPVLRSPDGVLGTWVSL